MSPSRGPVRPVDVLVIGAGLAGVAAATGLARRGANVLLAERAADVPRRFHGESIQPYGVTLLRKLGMGHFVEGLASQPIREFRFADLDADGSAAAEVLVRYPEGHVALAQPNFRLSSAIWEHARDELGERFLTGATVRAAGGRFSIQRDGEESAVAPKWVVAADGRHSAMRAHFRKPARAQGCVIAAPLDLIVGGEIHARAAVPGRCTVIRSHRSGTFCFFPLDAERLRVYWNVPVRAAGGNWRERLGAALETLPAELRFGTLGEEVAVTTAETRWNGAPAIGRVLFAGDAAAVTTPFGGQGMTCALEHADALLQILGSGASDALVRQAYAAAVRQSFRRVNVVNVFLYHVFFSRSALTRPLARYVVDTWAWDPAIADLVAGLFSGIDCRRAALPDVIRILGLHTPARLLRMLVRTAALEAR